MRLYNVLATCFVWIMFSFCFLSSGNAAPGIKPPLVSLKAIDLSVRAILEDIELQTGYEIIVNDTDVLNKKKSFFFNEIPLEQSIARLFKKVNHSIVVNYKSKQLTILLLNQKSLHNSLGTYASTPTSTGMIGVDRAFEQAENSSGDLLSYQNMKVKETTMDGVDTAFEIAENNNGQLLSYEEMKRKETTMDGVNVAFGRSEKNSGQLLSYKDMKRHKSTMDGVDTAFEQAENDRGQLLSLQDMLRKKDMVK